MPSSLLFLLAFTASSAWGFTALSNSQLTDKFEKLADDVDSLKESVENLTHTVDQLAQCPNCFAGPAVPDCFGVNEIARKNGVFTVNARSHNLTVFCDQTTNGGGWTVIQRRQNGNVEFYRYYVDYISGFGLLSDEFWLGLDNIFFLTAAETYVLRVDLWDFRGNTAYAEYRNFSVGGQLYNGNYILHVDDYHGTAGDAMGYSNGAKFSTNDRDYDDNGQVNCAQRWHGSWWYKDQTCYRANLNGRYFTTPVLNPEGIIWYPWRGAESLKKVEMKIRPVTAEKAQH